jgi:uncharacterized protein GlcG (DUF336 family)
VVNTFGGGLALYDRTGTIRGAVGVSGDTVCRHMVAWRVRKAISIICSAGAFQGTLTVGQHLRLSSMA